MTMTMCIVMNMNIYISAENEKRLRKEPSMSGLVNRLLKEHYNKTPPPTEYVEETGFVKTEDLKNITIPEEVTVQSTPVSKNSLARAKTSEGVKLANEAIEKKVQKDEKPQYCRNGHYLGATGKCLQKDCRYA